MKRFSSAFALLVFAWIVSCSSSSHPATAATGCAALGGDATCTSCLSAHCGSASSAAASDCASIEECYCGCGLGGVCCVETCGPSPACVTDTRDLSACAAASCATECTISPVGLCAGVVGEGGSSPSDAGGATQVTPEDGQATGL
jgi:hypothetical protein